MQNSSHKLSTPVAIKRICKQKKNNTYTLNPIAYAKVADISAVRYPTCVKSAGFWSQLEASLVSYHSDELWYNETVFLWMTIYIYIYIFPSVPIGNSTWQVLYMSSSVRSELMNVVYAGVLVEEFKGEYHLRSTLLLQQCPVCLVRHTWVICEMGGKWLQ